MSNRKKTGVRGGGSGTPRRPWAARGCGRGKWQGQHAPAVTGRRVCGCGKWQKQPEAVARSSSGGGGNGGSIGSGSGSRGRNGRSGSSGINNNISR